jgi:pimeloyl-ACP methyl ester carboxylesterase
MTATPVNLPIWREAFWPAEWLQLRISPLYQGVDIPRADGDPVVLVPGFIASDTSLLEMHGWLERIGYDAYTCGFDRNLDCPDVLLARLVEKVENVRAQTGRSVHIIGHSLGGSLARAAAIQRPDLVAQVITLGAPLTGLSIHPLMVALAEIIERATPSPNNRPRPHEDHLHTGSCSRKLKEAMQQPFPQQIPRTSIYSLTDGIVDWHSSEDDPPDINVEVRATHIGLIFNRDVYKEIARLLASVESAVSAPPPVPAAVTA